METWLKKACVSTLLLKCYLIISELQILPWPRPDIALGLTGPLQSGPAHAAWEDRELGLVAVGVGTGVAYADVEHH